MQHIFPSLTDFGFLNVFRLRKNIGRLSIIKNHLISSKEFLNFLAEKNQNFCNEDKILFLMFNKKMDFYASSFNETIKVFNPIGHSDNDLLADFINHIKLSEAILDFFSDGKTDDVSVQKDFLLKEIQNIDVLIESIEKYRQRTEELAGNMLFFSLLLPLIIVTFVLHSSAQGIKDHLWIIDILFLIEMASLAYLSIKMISMVFAR